MLDITQIKAQLARIELVDQLLPRRRSIYETICEQQTTSADYLYRNFAGTPQSTIRFDLLQLQKQKLIKKLGTTRGVLYSSFPE